MRLVIALGFLSISVPHAYASDLPQVDVWPECNSYAIRGQVDVIKVTEFCAYKNALAQESLQKIWPTAHETVQQKCGALPPHQPFFYQAVLSCVTRGERFFSKEYHPPRPGLE